MGDFPATMARKITQLIPSLTPTLGIVLSFCHSYLALWQPLSGIRRSRWLARRSVFRFRQIKTMSVNAPRARVSPTDRPTDRPVTHLLSPDSVSRSAPRVCLPSSSFVAVAVCLVTRMSFLATCRPQLSAVSQSHLATSVRLFIFFSVSSA